MSPPALSDVNLSVVVIGPAVLKTHFLLCNSVPGTRYCGFAKQSEQANVHTVALYADIVWRREPVIVDEKGCGLWC